MDLGVILDTVKIIWSVTSKCVTYHRGLNENMNIFKETLKELNSRKTDIEYETRPELHPEKIIKQEVVIWLEKVQDFNADKSLEEKFAKVKFISRAYLGRLVVKKIQDVEKHRQKGSFSDGLMVDATPSKGQMLLTTTLAGNATIKKVEDIWNSLINDTVLKIGVYGMGGSGKTTIMKHIRNRVLKQNDKFDKVHWITASREDTSVLKLQNAIAKALKIKDFEKIEEKVDRDAMLCTKLEEEKRCVLIFDDVWEAFKLEDVGIPEPTVGNGCKLILTTRSLEVCQRMGCEPTKMELLSEDEAWNLFLEKIGPGVSMTSGLEKIAKKVARECACLPLAIVTIGTSMKGVVNKSVWKTTLRKLRECTKGLTEMNEKVIEQLKYSYTRLNDEQAQRCLLYCALYPEDYEIERQELISYLIAEEIIEGMESRNAKFDEGHTILKTLENACLLESCSETIECVKMHDVVRDMALQIRGRGSMVECGVQTIKFPEEDKWDDNLETVSLMGTNIKEIPVDASRRCSRLKTLLLSNNMLSSIPDSFFVHMPSLCVLDLSRMLIYTLPNSISDLENLTALILRKSVVRYVPSLAKLRRLRVLDLCDTLIEQVPYGMEILVNLHYLNIEGIRAKRFPTGILPKLIQLQFFSASFDFEIKGEELMGLKKLERLACRLSVNGFNSYINYLQSHHRRLPKCYVLHCGSGELWEADSVDDESKNFKIVRVGFFKEEKEEEEAEYPITLQQYNVKEISIIDWDEVREVSGLPVGQVELWFYAEVVKFLKLRKLRVLVDRSLLLSHGTFSSLRDLLLSKCHKLKHLFKLELLSYFPNLEAIAVIACAGMKELVAVEEGEEESESDEEKESESEEEEEESDELSIVNDALTITFPKLRSLALHQLPRLKSVIGRRGTMVCDSIEEISIIECYPKRFPLSLSLSSNDQPSPPASLKEIEVETEYWNWLELEWGNPMDKDVLQPFVGYNDNEY